MPNDLDLLKAARLILEGKKPEKKDKKDDDIEIDVKTKDGKVTKLHTKDGDGDGKVMDGTKAEQKVPSKDKKKDDSKSDDGSSDDKTSSKKSDDSNESGDDSKPKKKGDSPVKDDSNDDGAEEKEVPDDSSDDDSKSDDEDSDDSDDELDKSKDGDGSDQKSDSEKEDEVDGSEKTKINLKPKIKDEEPGEMPVSENTLSLYAELQHLRDLAERYEGVYVGMCADAVYRARANAISMLESQVHESFLQDIVVYLDQGFSVVSEKYGEGECIPGEFFVNEDLSVDASVMFEHGVEDVKVDITEISKDLVKRYAKRAAGELAAHSFFDGAYSQKGSDVSKNQEKIHRDTRRKSLNRERGVKKAIDRLSEEEVNEKHIGFKKLEKKLSHEKGVYNPAGLAAAIGRKKYGAKKFKQMSEENNDPLAESFAQAGTNALQIAKHHEAMQAHHEEMAAHHENDENYGLAKNHDMAAHLHSQAADSYRDAARAFRSGADDRGDYHLNKASRHADSAEQHEDEHNIRPSAS
jgi:hypothetical protein